MRLDADTIKARADARRVAHALGVRVASRSGERWTVHCPNGGAHSNGDRNPSASVWRDGWRCHGCGEGGSVLDLVALCHGLDVRASFRSVLDLTADLAGIAAMAGPRPPLRVTAHPVAAQETVSAPFDVEARNELVTAIWCALADVRPTDELSAWLRARGIRWATAADLGVRDPAPVLDAIRDVLDAADLSAAGFTSAKGLWWPLRAMLDGDRRHAGCLIPCVDPVLGSFAIRWRYYQAPSRAKALALPASESPLLGVRYDECESARVLFVAEGETDWLAVHDALRALSAGHAWCIGLPMVSKGWPLAWGPIVRQADRVVVVTDMGKPTTTDRRPTAERIAAGVAKSLAVLLGSTVADVLASRVVCLPFPDDNDCADYHQRGELADVLRDYL